MPAFTLPNTYRQELKFQRESDNLGYGEQEHKMAVSMTCSYHQRIQIQKSLDSGSVQVKLTHTLEMVYSSNCRCLPLQPARRKKDGADCSIYDSMAYSELSSVSAVQNKDSVVRIVLASRMVEVYDGAILAYSVMHKYPGLCLARPEVFKRPHESLVGPKEVLLPGQKFYLVPKTTVKKLQQNHPKKPQALAEAAVRGMVSDHQVSDKEEGEEAVCSAKDFYVENEERSQRLVRKLVKGSGKQEQKKPFNPPIKTSPRRKKGVLDGWKPALTSVEEISP